MLRSVSPFPASVFPYQSTCPSPWKSVTAPIVPTSPDPVIGNGTITGEPDDGHLQWPASPEISYPACGPDVVAVHQSATRSIQWSRMIRWMQKWRRRFRRQWACCEAANRKADGYVAVLSSV
ncbi:hypothetical protein BV898_11137 [Hypsibius exemplaris]|uniref:Uncharacterized protein n=1 Tax=Hypsibius exemplaris TaxID=2072580 RepID=A0A1W0WHH1_HYPEX|nr:hypothetical protein BV898_11137 [Hypsibius exemplaris]